MGKRDNGGASPSGIVQRLRTWAFFRALRNAFQRIATCLDAVRAEPSDSRPQVVQSGSRIKLGTTATESRIAVIDRPKTTESNPVFCKISRQRDNRVNPVVILGGERSHGS